ncbi:MAG: M15 family metallopeptidase [Bacteroidia bacterium]|jgi:D-alanyl-D-alanine carboxypeptidase
MGAPETLIELDFDLDLLIGKVNPQHDDRFALIPSQYCGGAEHYLLKSASLALINMIEQAQRENIALTIISATRNFERQKAIWERKWSGAIAIEGLYLNESALSEEEKVKQILRYSAMPATSRHHWGTDVDLNSVEPEYFETSQGSAEYDWLVLNAPLFGYEQPYTAKDHMRPKGYEEEKWHWSFVPYARPMLGAYRAKVGYTQIQGFNGANYAENLRIIEDYVCGIAVSCG